MVNFAYDIERSNASLSADAVMDKNIVFLFCNDLKEKLLIVIGSADSKLRTTTTWTNDAP